MSIDKKTIWIVDDDESIGEVVKLILEQEGYSIESVLSEKQLHEKLTHSQPDLILIDLRIAGSDGAVITKDIKNNKKTASIPIVLLSADIDIKDQAKNSHANGFIKKPFDLTDLITVVKQHTTA